MRSLKLRPIVCATVLLALPLAAAVLLQPRRSVHAAPNPAARPQDTPQQPIRVQVNLVNIFATVRDKHTKQIVSTLEQNDFTVSEDGVDQKITFFTRDSKLPVTLALLLDTSGSEQETLGAEQQAAVRFLTRVMRKGDLTSVISFDTDADLLADFTEDVGRLESGIRRARINAPGFQGPLAQQPAGTVLYDAVYLACHDKLASEAGRKALIIITDAYDTGSRVSLQEAIEAAQRTDTVVHILLVGDQRMGGVNESVSRKLTDETGGRTIVVRSEKNLENAFDQISEELRSQYSIAYSSTNQKRDGTYRKVKVGTTRKDLDVLARRGYYAAKE